MQDSQFVVKRRWVLAAAAGGILAVFLASLFRAPRSPAGRPSAAGPIVILAPPDTLQKEETVLHDPAPLFLPTEWNSRPVVKLREPGGAFAAYPAEFRFDPDGLKISLPDDVPARPGDALAANPPGNSLLGIGRTDAVLPTLAARGAFVEIVAAGTGDPVFAGPLADLPAPWPSLGANDMLWKPLEFIAAVDAAGLVGPLVLTARSDVEEVDVYFENYLAQTLKVGMRLPPGFYRIRVGP